MGTAGAACAGARQAARRQRRTCAHTTVQQTRLSNPGMRACVRAHGLIARTQDYMAAGAIPSDDMSEADVIMSVKTVPINELIPNKTYVFFSHTIKAQRDNMALLDAILEKVRTCICMREYSVEHYTNRLRENCRFDK